MKEQIEKLYIDALNEDLPPNVFADQVLRLFNVSGMLPINDAQIRAYGLLQLIAKAEIAEPSAYNPENDIRKRNIANWKQEYYTLIGNLL